MRKLLILLTVFTLTSVPAAHAGVVGDLNEDGRIDIFDVIELLRTVGGRQQHDHIGRRYVLAEGGDSLAPHVLPVDTVHGVPMVRVPAGSFVMGGTVSPTHHHGTWPMHMQRAVMHAVGVDSFWIASREITREMFEEVMGFDPSEYADADSLPVHGLSWFDAARFCNALSIDAGLETVYDTTTWQADLSVDGFRLPTEAEWEYACRAGSATLFYTGNQEEDLRRAGWYDANSDGLVHPVAQLQPNGWGLYDMMGNAAEWCNDWYDEQYYGGDFMDDPAGPDSGSYRVVRGGAFNSVYSRCSSAFRGFAAPDSTEQAFGLRVVRNP